MVPARTDLKDLGLRPDDPRVDLIWQLIASETTAAPRLSPDALPEFCRAFAASVDER